MAVALPVDMDAPWPARSGRTAGAEAIETDVMIDQALAPSPPGAPGQARTAAVGLDKIQGALLHTAKKHLTTPSRLERAVIGVESRCWSRQGQPRR